MTATPLATADGLSVVAHPRWMSPNATLWREIDALGGGSSGHSDFMRGWDAGHSEALGKVLAILERRGFTEQEDANAGLCAALADHARWLQSIRDIPWDEIVADGGVTAWMVIQQEARTVQLPRIRAALAKAQQA